ncbi:zinc ribbon domain-containing protein [Vallitalea okinawensis]|uniref:zinc ribbon domain-containing protein n=1 Tax=Vallitalea okinawensis TaxID=2078660 RepID=UPI000CFAE155|nr:zinc ribbon domain-containing protein [Vallitalea okinawensis]
MKCSQCGFENGEQGKFCGKCGASMNQEKNEVIEIQIEVEEEQTNSEDDVVIEDDDSIKDQNEVENNEPVGNENVVEEENDESTELINVKEETKKSNKVNLKLLLGIGGGILAVLILVFAGSKVVTSTGASSKYVDLSNAPFVYAADGDHYIMPIGEEAIEIKGTVDYVRTKNTKDYYISTQEGKLYHYQLGNEDIEKIDKDVLTFRISEDGKTVVYETQDDNDLYLYQNNDVELIEKDIWSFEMSANGKYIAYISEYEVSEGGELHLYKVGKEEEELENEASEVAAVFDDGSIYYLDEDYRLYYQKGDDKQRIAKDVYDYAFSTKGDKVAWINDDDELYIKVGDREEKIDKGVAYIYTAYWAAHSNRLDLIYNKDYEKDYLLIEEDEKGKKLSEDYMSYDYASFEPMYAIADDEDLSVYHRKGKEWQEEKIENEEDIQYVLVSAYGDYVVFADDDNQLFYWKSGEPRLIDKDFDYNTGQIWMDKDSHTIIYTDEDKTLKVSKKGKEGTEIIDDVQDFYVRNLKTILVADEDGDLMQVNLKGDTEGVEDDFEGFYYIGTW